MLRIRTLAAGVAASLLTTAGSALAADLSQPSYNPPPQYAPAPAAWSWSGAYGGLVGGYGWGSGIVSNNGWIGGGYLGYNVQTNQHLVVGIEGDLTATSKSGGGGALKNPWDGTFRGRVGYAWDRSLVYGTAGVAVGGLDGVDGSTTKTGWVAGLGVETAFTTNVTGRAEYRHTDLGDYGGSTYSSNDLLVGEGLKF